MRTPAAGRHSFVILCLAVPLGAQASYMPQPVIYAGCEYIKPGMGPAHDKHEERWARATEAVKGIAPALAIQSATGPNVTCWLTGLASYDNLGKNNALSESDPTFSKLLPSFIAGDAQYISDFRASIAVLRPDLSAGPMPNVLTRKFTNWGEWRIRPGQEQLFEKAAKAYAAATKRAGAAPEFRVYQVMQGAPAAMFWVFTSHASMAGFDADVVNGPKISAAFTEADQKLFDEFFTKAVLSLTENLWNYVPAQSIFTAEQRATDPFWRLKPAAKP